MLFCRIACLLAARKTGKQESMQASKLENMQTLKNDCMKTCKHAKNKKCKIVCYNDIINL